jgi:Holliday junction resolvasome RuvABC DNA-binding subunit
MAHPFEKLFAKALSSSTEYDNQVLEVAETLVAQGYRRGEVAAVLKKYAQGLIDDGESTIVYEAYEAVGIDLDD